MSQRKRKFYINSINKKVIQRRKLEVSLKKDFLKNFMIFESNKTTIINILSKETRQLLKKEKKAHIYSPINITIDFLDGSNFIKEEECFI